MAEKVKICKMCGMELGGQYSKAEEDKEIIVVDEKRIELLNKGDCLCEKCIMTVTYYRRVK